MSKATTAALGLFLATVLGACAGRPSSSSSTSPASALATTMSSGAQRDREDEVVPWLREHLSPIATDDPSAATHDLGGPLRSIIKDARVIGLGEATHGTRELFRLKHRMIAALATEMNDDAPCTVAMEADFSDAIVVDRYINSIGSGASLQATMSSLYLIWRTEEIADLLEWMRAFNQDPAHPRKIRFFGFDAQGAHGALRAVRTYLERVDPKAIPLLAALEPLEAAKDEAAIAAYSRSASDRSTKVRAALDTLLARFDGQRTEHVRRSSEVEWATVRQQLVTAKQAELVMSAQNGRERFVARDQAMADNIRWIADVGSPKARVAVWAHNGHIAHPAGAPTMGARLHEALSGDGDNEYVAIGLFFDSGSFQTFDFTGGGFRWKETTLGATPDHFATATFAKTGVPMFMIDLRARPQPPAVTKWLTTDHPIREVGHTFENEERATRDCNLADEVDAAVFVARTTRARPHKARPSTP